MYKIMRIFREDNKPSRNVRGLKNLTLEEAQAHCRNPETSSSTCTGSAPRRRTAQHGAWFDAYAEQ